MGAIYVGKKIGPGGFEKEVVLKQLLPEFTSRPEFRDLFFREAKISATLDHQNIVRTFDLVNSNDRLFIVMEYVRGADLRTIAWRARRRKPLSPKAILHVAMEILAGLGYAHSRRSPTGDPLRIIHRDLSPSNILCSGEGEVKLSDFGIAKAVTYSSVFYRVRGKVGYMSPEMARNQPIDARSDLFSLGVSIYETLIGERIYTGDLNTPPDKIYAQPVPPLESKCPGLPKALQSVLDRALTIDADERYPDAESFSHAIRQVALAHNLLYSAPELAAELREIMGPRPEHWLSDQRDPARLRSVRAPQGPHATAGQPGDSVVEPDGEDVSMDSADSSGLGEVATPPARPSAAMPAANPRPSGQFTSVPGWSSDQWPSLGNRPSAQMPTAQAPAVSSRPSAQMPVAAPPAIPLRPSASIPARGSQPIDTLAATPPPVVPLPPVAPTPVPARSGLGFARFYLQAKMGGVAAIRRSRRGLWFFLLFLVAVLLGFGAVRFLFSSEAPGANSLGPEPSLAPSLARATFAQAPPWNT